MLAEEILTKLDVVPLEQLKIHEQVIEANMRSLREKMLNHGRIVDPIVVDKEHKVVLDGNHRRMVLDTLKIENAVVQLVDYEDPSVVVGGWFLAIKNPRLDGLKFEKTDCDTGKEAIENLGASFMMQRGDGECLLFATEDNDLQMVLADQQKVIKHLWGGQTPMNGGDINRLFIEDSRVQDFLDDGYSVFSRRIFTKEEIIKEAIAGRPLPAKSTRHAIPNRIVRLNFKLGILNETIDEAKMQLRASIRKRVRFGSARYYTEPVIVLY
jgi:hypothetical protein